MVAEEGREHNGVTLEPEILRVPGWEQFPWLRAGFATRHGGNSQVYGASELNLAWTVEDDPRDVAANRAAFVRVLTGGTSFPLITVRQVHGSRLVDLETEPQPWITPDGKALQEADGLISRKAQRLLAILTADCVPVLLADTATHAVGAVHAGWRGTLASIVQHGVETMQTNYGSRPEHVIAAIGPCIRACCFEVGEEVEASFDARFTYAPELFRRTQESSLRLDLARANRRQLMNKGVPEGNIVDLGECTACARNSAGQRNYFSYRGEGGRTGRMMSAIAALV